MKNLKATAWCMGVACIALWTFSSRAETAAPRIIQLAGTDWRIHDDSDGKGAERRMFEADASASGWIPASVPGNIQADIEAARELNPLGYGVLDPRWYDVPRKDWWYRKDFTVPAELAGKRLTLVFDGVDHECQVWLNGKQLGANAGMFRRFQFDVTGVAKPGKTNQLALRIVRMPEQLAPILVELDSGLGSIFRGTNATRNVLKDLKSTTNWGWDWSVNVWTLGIWKDVRLEATGPARIDWTRVQTSLSDNHAKAQVAALLEIDSAADMPAKARFQIVGQGQTADATVDATIKKGRNVVKAELTLDKPALWWPNGQGDQPLYTLHAELLPANTGPAMDARDTRFAVRDVRWVHTEGAPANFVSRYQLIINGRPVRLIGSNLTPPDLLFGRMNPRAMQVIRHAKASGMNMFRLWGGGVILHPEAFDLADELGIMISVEMPLANCWPEQDEVFLSNLETTIRCIVREVRNHPSVIEYSGGNEMPWKTGAIHPALRLMQKIAAEEDGRLFRATCPDVGAYHGPYYIDIRSDLPQFDKIETMRWGEFGSASVANLEVWHRDIPPKVQWPIIGMDDPVLNRKNIFRGWSAVDFWLRKGILDGIFGPLQNLPDMVKAGQLHGAEGLRYGFDAMRRKGRRIGGMANWDFNEPWPNGAGSYMVDSDGRTLMNYDFFKQAIAPISLSLKYQSPFYAAETGMKAELFLASDAPQAAENLRWKWLARDRRGRVFAEDKGAASIDPIEVKSLGAIHLMPPKENAFGPIFVELRLEDSSGKLLTERLHIFGLDNVTGPLAGLLKNRMADSEDDNRDDLAKVRMPSGPGTPENLAFVGNGAKPAAASSAYPDPRHQPVGLNDGRYGNDHSWIGAAPKSWFQIELGKPAVVGQFKLGRDHVGEFADRAADYLKIETSLDGQTWKTVFEKSGIVAMPGFGPTKTTTINIAPVETRFVRATVDPAEACIDEFEIYAPAKERPAALPSIAFAEPPEKSLVYRSVQRTSLAASTRPVRMESDQEVFEMTLKNTGPMTALFCEPHPMIEYRTDLFIDNNHCFIPPGESRTITIRADRKAAGGLSLAQTGWRVSCWNADDATVEPSGDVLLAVGRRDKMCREYLGYFDASKINDVKQTSLEGRSPDTAQLPYLLEGDQVARFKFSVSAAQAKRPARLRIHAADQSKDVAAVVAVTVNGQAFEKMLPKGIALQKDDPAHLAFPATATFEIPTDLLREGENVVEVRGSNGGWFTWDAMDLVNSD